ncbi:FkbM family methyltransferase [Rhodovulum bhavnagarense]|uniref:FkbM family methyltransferase n=1 Tax=Rhodovulum bhavnagarense TaxID=992286 RepID=UPI00104C8ADB|nr:FkbM family methyltransferase [Rhodovulum bhavnagarense]
MRLSGLKAGIKNSLRPALPFFERTGLYDPPGFGLNGLDKKLLKHIGFRNGVFAEAGANNGIRQSNTAYLEFYRGWTGLLVEPIPELAQQCRINRPKSRVEEYALTSLSSSGAPVEMIYCNLMSIVKGARGGDTADEAHIAAGMKFLAGDDAPRHYSVPTASLDMLFRLSGISRVDLLSLDVEGYEAQALAGLDFDRVAPRWILVEANDPQEIENVLAARYELVDHLSHHDRLYRLKS